MASKTKNLREFVYTEGFVDGGFYLDLMDSSKTDETSSKKYVPTEWFMEFMEYDPTWDEALDEIGIRPHITYDTSLCNLPNEIHDMIKLGRIAELGRDLEFDGKYVIDELKNIKFSTEKLEPLQIRLEDGTIETLNEGREDSPDCFERNGNIAYRYDISDEKKLNSLMSRLSVGVSAKLSAGSMLEMFGKRSEPVQLSDIEEKLYRWSSSYAKVGGNGPVDKEYLFAGRGNPHLLLSLAQDEESKEPYIGLRRHMRMDFPPGVFREEIKFSAYPTMNKISEEMCYMLSAVREIIE